MIIDNLLKSHFMPSGAGLMVKLDVHAALKEYKDKVIKPGFKIGQKVPVHNFETIEQKVDLEFKSIEGGSSKRKQV
jgi:hypothetical protein